MRIAGKVRIFGALGAILVIVAMLALGCGGGSDKADVSGSKDSGKDSASATASKSSGSTSKQAEGADKYASQVCTALNKYTDDIEELSNGPSDVEDASALKDYVNSMAPVMNGISKDMDKINPPSEVTDWHNGVVSGMADAAKLLAKMGDALDKPMDEAMAEITDLSSQMDDVGNPFGSMSDLPDDYQQAFENNPDCKKLQDLNVFE